MATKRKINKDDLVSLEEAKESSRKRNNELARIASREWHNRMGREAEARKKQNSGTKAHRSQRDIERAWLDDMTPADGDPKTRAVRGKIAQRKEENKERYWDQYYDKRPNIMAAYHQNGAQMAHRNVETYHNPRNGINHPNYKPEYEAAWQETYRRMAEEERATRSGGTKRTKHQR